jgi:hypothetical protein
MMAGPPAPMKLLFLMDSPEYLRFYDSAIAELAARGHQVHLAVMSGRHKKPVGLEGLRAHAGGVRVVGVVPAHDGPWGGIAAGLRAVMDFVRFLHPAFAAAPALRARIKRKVLPRAYHWLDAIPQLGPGTVRAVQRVLATLERAIPVPSPISDVLQNEAPDVLLVSPLVAAASEQVDWVKAARALGVRSAVGVASWDNLTNKGLLRLQPDQVLVWNDAQRHEARTYHYIPDDRIAATGAQLFDRWFEARPSSDREVFCRRVGLPDDRPFVLFTGSSGFISESSAEVAFVRRWLQALRASTRDSVRDVNVLVRPHPYNCHGWETDPLRDLPGVAVYPRRGYNPIDAGTRTDFFDSLFHSAAVVGINTSAMIEAAIIGRPVCSILAPEFAATQEGTIHFRHLLPENGGFLRLAATLDEHVDQLAGRLEDPAGSFEETQRFARAFIRPHGLDRPATPVFVNVLEGLAARPAPRPLGLPVWAPLLWPILWVAAAPAWIVDRLAAVPRPTVRTRAAWARHRGRKVLRGAGTRIGSRIGSRLRKGHKVVLRSWQRSVHRWHRVRAR